MELKHQIDKNNIPQHVAIIMDGNGRWAKSRGEDRVFGHLNGVDSVRESLKTARELGVKYLTLYAFSTENWNRPKEEVDALMDLLVETIINEIEELHENSVRLEAIGDIENLPEKCQTALKKGIEKTKQNDNITLILALSYSSRWEITNAIKSISEKVKKGILEPNDINDKVISDHLTTKNFPDPDLLIRTSGENRISNFLLWQIAYAELYFTETFWPEFRKNEFYKAVISYQNRERRFGKTSEQIIEN
ncbi:MAG: isoprenyl transferase [Flavobacteriales bacterium]|nr:isoprenyl transferase [Flavobacteriales bacterium]